MFSLYLHLRSQSCAAHAFSSNEDLPLVVYGLDDEAQGWTDAVDVFIHDSLHDCGLAAIVQTTIRLSAAAPKNSHHLLTASVSSSPCPSSELSSEPTTF